MKCSLKNYNRVTSSDSLDVYELLEGKLRFPIYDWVLWNCSFSWRKSIKIFSINIPSNFLNFISCIIWKFFTRQITTHDSTHKLDCSSDTKGTIIVAIWYKHTVKLVSSCLSLGKSALRIIWTFLRKSPIKKNPIHERRVSSPLITSKLHYAPRKLIKPGIF